MTSAPKASHFLCFFNDLRLAYAVGVVAFLNDYALHSLHCCLGSNGCAVVSGSCSDNALVTQFLGVSYSACGTPVLERTGSVGSFVLYENSCAIARLGIFS